MTDEAKVEETPATPSLQIITPGVTAEETAIVVALFAGMGGGETVAKKPVRAWNAPHRVARRALPHGVGGWRASALPR